MITLQPNHRLVAPAAVVERRGGAQFGNLSDVRIKSLNSGNLCHYVGHVKGHEGSKVAMETCNGLVSTTLNILNFLFFFVIFFFSEKDIC